MKIIYNKFLPIKGNIAMITLFILWVRKEYKGTNYIDKQLLNHERTHSYQQIEIWVLSIVIMLALCYFVVLSWWWLCVTPIIPLLIYVLCWLIEIILPPYNSAYRNICFETEAIYNEHDSNYLDKKRKLFTFRFLKYISNKKYPYLSWAERRRRYNATIDKRGGANV